MWLVVGGGGTPDEGEAPAESEQPDADADEEAPPLSTRETITEVAGGLFALVVFSVGVLALYVLAGLMFGFLSWAAPAVLAIGAVIFLARFFARQDRSDNLP